MAQGTGNPVIHCALLFSPGLRPEPAATLRDPGPRPATCYPFHEPPDRPRPFGPVRQTCWASRGRGLESRRSRLAERQVAATPHPLPPSPASMPATAGPSVGCPATARPGRRPSPPGPATVAAAPTGTGPRPRGSGFRGGRRPQSGCYLIGGGQSCPTPPTPRRPTAPRGPGLCPPRTSPWSAGSARGPRRRPTACTAGTPPASGPWPSASCRPTSPRGWTPTTSCSRCSGGSSTPPARGATPPRPARTCGACW
jgi:hypothetical protein